MTQTIISRNDYDKLQNLVSSDDVHRMNQSEKQKKVTMNKEKLAKWGLAADQIKLRNAEDHFKKFEQKELEQRSKEVEFKKILDQEKDAVRSRAAQMKVQDSERVRELNSAIQYSKVLKEREEQYEIKNAKQEYEGYIEGRHHEQLVTQLEQENLTAEQKSFQARMQRKNNFNAIKQQRVDEANNKVLNSQIDHNYDKGLIKKAMDDMIVEKQKEDKKREAQVKLVEDTLISNKEQQKLHKKKLQEEQEQERMIAEYAKQKEAKEKMFKDKVEKKRKEAQDIRQKMIDRQAEYLLSLQKNEEVRLDGQIKQKDAEAKAKFLKDQAKKAEALAVTKKFNTKLIEGKDSKKAQLKEQDRQYAKQIRHINTEIAKLEQEEVEEEKARNLQMQNYLIKQVEYKNSLKMREVEEERNAYLTQQDLLRKEDEDFKSYAEKYLQEGSVQGLNTKTLLLKLKNLNNRD